MKTTTEKQFHISKFSFTQQSLFTKYFPLLYTSSQNCSMSFSFSVSFVPQGVYHVITISSESKFSQPDITPISCLLTTKHHQFFFFVSTKFSEQTQISWPSSTPDKKKNN